MAADPLRGRNVPEDAVQYSLFLTKPSLTDAEDNERKLLHLKEQILTCFANLLVQYIWQKQPFSLKYQPETGNDRHILIMLCTSWKKLKPRFPLTLVKK